MLLLIQNQVVLSKSIVLFLFKIAQKCDSSSEITWYTFLKFKNYKANAGYERISQDESKEILLWVIDRIKAILGHFRATL